MALMFWIDDSKINIGYIDMQQPGMVYINKVTFLPFSENLPKIFWPP